MADQTAGIARAAVPGGNAYVRMRDELESLVEDPELAHVFPRRGQAAEHPWDLGLRHLARIPKDWQESDWVRSNEHHYLVGHVAHTCLTVSEPV